MPLIKVPVPWRGMNLTSEPDALTAGQGVFLRNMLAGRTGQLVPRGPLFGLSSVPPVTNKDTQFDAAGGFWISPDASGGSFLSQAGSGSAVSVDGAAAQALPGTVTQITASYATMGAYTVGCTGLGFQRLMTWNGVGPGTFVELTNGPTGIDAVVSHQSRVFALNSTGKLYWTDPVPDLPTNTAALWQDDVSGLANRILLPAGELYRDIVAFNRMLCIIGSQSVYLLTGDTPASYTLRKVMDVGAGPLTGYSYAGSAGTSAQRLYFWSSDGIMSFDGASSSVVSRAVAPLIAGSSYVRITAIADEYISVISSGWWLLYHEPTGSWSSLTSALFGSSPVHGVATGLPTHVRQTGARWTAFSAGKSSAPSSSGRAAALTFDPDQAAALQSSSPFWWQEAGLNLDCQALSASIRLAGPDKRASLQRLFAQAGGGAWNVQIEDEDGVVLGTSLMIPPIPATPSRTRAEIPLFSDVDIVRVRFLWRGTSNGRAPSVGDAFVLTDGAQQR